MKPKDQTSLWIAGVSLAALMVVIISSALG